MRQNFPPFTEESPGYKDDNVKTETFLKAPKSVKSQSIKVFQLSALKIEFSA